MEIFEEHGMYEEMFRVQNPDIDRYRLIVYDYVATLNSSGLYNILEHIGCAPVNINSVNLDSGEDVEDQWKQLLENLENVSMVLIVQFLDKSTMERAFYKCTNKYCKYFKVQYAFRNKATDCFDDFFEQIKTDLPQEEVDPCDISENQIENIQSKNTMDSIIQDGGDLTEDKDFFKRSNSDDFDDETKRVINCKVGNDQNEMSDSSRCSNRNSSDDEIQSDSKECIETVSSKMGKCLNEDGNIKNSTQDLNDKLSLKYADISGKVFCFQQKANCQICQLKQDNPSILLKHYHYYP